MEERVEQLMERIRRMNPAVVMGWVESWGGDLCIVLEHAN
jgi:hypothetical protein